MSTPNRIEIGGGEYERLMARRRELGRLSKHELAQRLVLGVTTRGGGRIANAGPVAEVMRWRKDEIITDLIDMQDRADQDPEAQPPPAADPDICPDCWHEHPEGEPCPPIGGRRP